MESFSSFPLSPALQARLAAGGFVAPTPIQSATIPALIAGRDVVGQARTGSGKTLAYVLPLLQRCEATAKGVQALVLVPTRELALQVGKVIAQVAGPHGPRTALVYGGRGMVAQQQALNGGAQIVVATPGRLLDHLRQGTARLNTVRVLVLDEADEMLDRGFGPDVERIIAQTPAARQTALFSATMPDWVRRTAARHLRSPLLAMVDTAPEDRPEIDHVVYEVPEDEKARALRTLLDRQKHGATIVFGRTKHRVKRLAQQLQAEGYPAAALQGNMSQNARERVIEDFHTGRVAVLLATNVAARGLDHSGVAQVINYELPESAEWFTHRAGRTARMGRQGTAITLLTPADLTQWRQIEKALGETFPRRSWKTDTVIGEPAPAVATPRRAPTPAVATPRRAPAPAVPSAAASRPAAQTATTPTGRGVRRPFRRPRV